MRIRNGDKPQSCETCEQSFTQKGHLSTHMLSLSRHKPYKCGICGKSFTFKGSQISKALTCMKIDLYKQK